MSRTYKTKKFEFQVGLKDSRDVGYHWQKERDMIDNPDLAERTAYFEEKKRIDVALFTKKVKFPREANGRRKAEHKRNKKHIRATSNKIKKAVASAFIDEDVIDALEAEFHDAEGFDVLYDMY